MNYRKIGLLVLSLATVSGAQGFFSGTRIQSWISRLNSSGKSILSFSTTKVNTIKVGQVITLSVNNSTTPYKGKPSNMKGDLTYFDTPTNKSNNAPTHFAIGAGSTIKLEADTPTQKRIAKVIVERMGAKSTVYKFKIVK